LKAEFGLIAAADEVRFSLKALRSEIVHVESIIFDATNKSVRMIVTLGVQSPTHQLTANLLTGNTEVLLLDREGA
jgi:hypothetical protein